MRRLLACAFACAALSLVAAPAAAASELWTFCVASARGDVVWITDVFAAPRDRVQLERDVKAYLARQGATRVREHRRIVAAQHV